MLEYRGLRVWPTIAKYLGKMWDVGVAKFRYIFNRYCFNKNLMSIAVWVPDIDFNRTLRFLDFQ